MSDANENNVFKLEHDIHKQFAENMNAHVKNFIAFIATIVALFYGFYDTYKRCCFSEQCDQQEMLICLFWLFVVSLVVLCFLCYICFHLGWSERRDQFVVAKIRRKHYKKENDDYCSIFKSFEPDKGDPLPDYYKNYIIFFIVIACIMFFMVLECFCKAGSNELLEIKSTVLFFVFLVLVFAKCCCIKNKYNDYCADYTKFTDKK